MPAPKEFGPPKRHKPPVKRAKCEAPKPNGQPCQMPAGHGTEHPGKGHCVHHGGEGSREARAVAKDDGLDLIESLRGMGISVDMDPGEALRWEVNNTLGHVVWHKAVIDKWELVDQDGRVRALTPEEEAFYERYVAERQHLVRGARMAVAADIDARAQALDEARAEMLFNSIDQILAALRLTAEQRELVPTVVPQVLRDTIRVKPLVIEGKFSTDDEIDRQIKQARKARE